MKKLKQNALIETFTLDHPILFIEFFVREFEFTGKSTVRTMLPKDAFFYSGVSKAAPFYREYFHNKEIKLPISTDVFIGFDRNEIYLSTKTPDQFIEKLFDASTNVVSVTGKEFGVYGAGYKPELVGKWNRSKTTILANKFNGSLPALRYAGVEKISPHGFSVTFVDKNESIWTHFPTEHTLLNLEVNKTQCFYIRKEEFSYGDNYQPNLNLLLFVKNHGFKSVLNYASPEELARMDSANLCSDAIYVRDFRKHS